MSWTELRARAETWIAQDVDPQTQAELRELIAKADADESARGELFERFSGPLAFGTAGLRGIIGAGETRMNRAVVMRTSYGLGAFLRQTAEQPLVVVGYDGRRLSREFTEDTAGVLASLGCRVKVCEGVCPTPLLAYAVLHFRAAAGVMVTASHNPPEYNGYKVYAGNGAQIIPPTDSGIAAAIAKAPPATEIERASLDDERISSFGEDLKKLYLDAVAKLSVSAGGDREIGVVYTAMHGVGDELVGRTLAAAGFTSVHSVPEQAEPDGAFPTVRFPNPEEPGALDLPLALARKTDAALIVANDPDADRLALAVRTAPGEYVQLTGNETGVLLGHYLLSEGPPGDRAVMASLVSSPMLGVIASSLGVRYAETLTGFKWIANEALALEQKTGTRFVFGYEEALGYTVGDLVRDKDGVSAARIACELAASLAAEGKTLIDRLQAIAREHGLFVSGQKSIVFPGSEGQKQMATILDRLRGSPPEAIGGLPVEAVRDYQTSERKAKDGTSERIHLPKSNVLAFELEGGNRVIARPSGTEPKIKFYFDLREPMSGDESYADAKARATERMHALRDAFVAASGVD